MSNQPKSTLALSRIRIILDVPPSWEDAEYDAALPAVDDLTAEIRELVARRCRTRPELSGVIPAVWDSGSKEFDEIA